MASSILASQTLILRAAPIDLRFSRNTATFSVPSAQNHHLHLAYSKPKVLTFYPLQNPSISRISASMPQVRKNPSIKSPQNPIPSGDLLSGSTRSVTSLFVITLAALKFLSNRLFSLGIQLKAPLLSAVGPAFFAASKNVPTGSLNTPFTVVAAGMAKWLDLYSGVLMVRVLLSWFPNIPWDRQPLSAIRDLCDPYLNLFRNIIPPIFNTLDVSPLLAFAVLGAMASILHSSRQAY